jgi:hypothetical protein
MASFSGKALDGKTAGTSIKVHVLLFSVIIIGNSKRMIINLFLGK